MGGYTSEHDISLKSGAVVMANINKEVYEPYAVHIDKDAWLVEVDGSWKPIDIADFSSGDLRFDMVFNAVHGTPGENGELQWEQLAPGELLDDHERRRAALGGVERRASGCGASDAGGCGRFCPGCGR